MFERNPKNKDAIEAAWKLLESRERGDMISHEEAEAAFGVQRSDNKNRYYMLIERLKVRMESERGISLVSVTLVGYALTNPREQLGYAQSRVGRAGRQYRKAKKTVDVLPASECSMPEQRAKIAFSDRLAAMERQQREESQRMAFLMRPRDSLPKRPIWDDENQVLITR